MREEYDEDEEEAPPEDEEDEDFFPAVADDAAAPAAPVVPEPAPPLAEEDLRLLPRLDADEPSAAARWLSRTRFAPRSFRNSSRAFCGFGSSLPSDSLMSAWMSALGKGGAGAWSAAQKAL